MQPACSAGPPTRCHLVPPGLKGHGGVVSWIMFLQSGCGVILVTVSALSQQLWDMGWLQNPWHPQCTPSDQAFQGEVGFWEEGRVGES